MSGDHAERGPASGSASRLRRSLERLFELPGALPLPGDHREIEQLVEAERHGEAATAIANLRFGRLAQQSRQATAQAICWMHAGRPERAVALLGAAKPTMTNAWVLACALVRVGRLDEAADHVTWVGDRRPLFGAERVAAQVLFRALGRPLPHWLIDPARGTSQDRPSRRPIPPPYLASFFYPMRPEVPTGFADAAEAIQEGRYGDAAQHLIARGVSGSRVGREVAIAAAECWLLADEPEAAAAWLQHRLSPEGTWTLACALVHQDRLEEALVPLAGLARRRLLHEDRRQAAAALVAHLGLEALPAGLEELEGHPFLDLPRAQEAGYRRFIDKVVREIQRHGDADSAERVVHRVLDQCESIPENEARRVLVPTYEAAVRACCARPLAERGLHLMLSRPELLGSRESEYSRALLFATASERLDELHEQLQLTADRTASRDVRFACLLASAKLKLVQADRQGATAAAEQARDVAVSSEDEGRAGRLVRAARWLPVAEGPRLSQWQLRQLHHLLPLAVAERLEDRDSRFLVLLEQCGRVSPAARPSVEAAGRCLRMAAAYADAPTGLPRLRRALGLWALHVGSALLAADRASGGEAVAFTGAAWRLLGPDPPPEVVAAHGRSVGIALAGLAEQIQVRARLDSVARAMPANEATETLIEAALDAWQERRRTRASGGGPRSLDRLLDPVSPRCSPPRAVDVITGIGRLEDLPPLARQAVEECLVDRLALLPEAAPYRGGRWFESNTAHRLYQQGREEQDARNAHKAFEQAWKAEPNNRITIQGLIFGLGRRLSEKSGRSHVLDHMARLLDQMAERELEAALACTTLARFARDDRERRDHQERAAAALERRVRRAPWARARNAEIALHLELGNLPAAGHAAWEESCLYLPGTEPSNRYALLAAALWERARDAEPRLEGLIRDARRRARSSRLTNRQAVQYTAVTTGRLVALTDLVLDDDVLEDLWRACRGDEGDLCRFLEKQGTRRVGPRPHYLRFLVRKLQTMDPAAAARIRNCYIARDCAPEPPNIRWLRLAMAELLTRDPLHEVAAPRDQLGECHMRELMFTLRQSSRGDEVAYAAFATAVEDALAALFELREAAPVSGPEQHGERLARASDALQVVRRAAMRFGVPVVSDLARQLFSYLALALEPPTVEVYLPGSAPGGRGWPRSRGRWTSSTTTPPTAIRRACRSTSGGPSTGCTAGRCVTPSGSCSSDCRRTRTSSRPSRPPTGRTSAGATRTTTPSACGVSSTPAAPCSAPPSSRGRDRPRRAPSRVPWSAWADRCAGSTWPGWSTCATCSTTAPSRLGATSCPAPRSSSSTGAGTWGVAHPCRSSAR